MNEVFFLKNCKCATLYYNDKDFYANNAYMEIYRMSFDFDFNKIDRYTIYYYAKKSNYKSCFISFSYKSFSNPETIDWDIIKKIYECPMSIKKFIEKNRDDIEKLIESARKDFQPHCKKFYGY